MASPLSFHAIYSKLLISHHNRPKSISNSEQNPLSLPNKRIPSLAPDSNSQTRSLCGKSNKVSAQFSLIQQATCKYHIISHTWYGEQVEPGVVWDLTLNHGWTETGRALPVTIDRAIEARKGITRSNFFHLITKHLRVTD